MTNYQLPRLDAPLLPAPCSLLPPLAPVIEYDVMELAPVVDSVVSQFTAAELVYKIIGYQALAKEWFKTSTTPPYGGRGLRKTSA